MRIALAAAAVVLAVAPLRAQDFFGLTPEDAQGAIGQAMAQQQLYEAQLAKKRAEKAKGPGMIDRALGTYAQLDADKACVYEAVAAHLGQDPKARPAPGVYLESVTLFEDFQQAAFSEDLKAWPQAFSTTYLSKADEIFLDDHAALYSPARTLADALAGQLAVAVLVRQGAALDAAKAQAPAVESWFHDAYTRTGRCAR